MTAGLAGAILDKWTAGTARERKDRPMRTLIIIAAFIWAALAAGTYLGQQSKDAVAVADMTANGARIAAADLRTK